MEKFGVALSLALACAGNASAQVDADALGRQEGYPLAPHLLALGQEKYMLGSYSNMAGGFAHRAVPAADHPSPLQSAPPPAGSPYAGAERALREYLERNRVTGLLVLRGSEILFERYQYDRKPEHLFTSNSMAKSVVGLAVGKALEDGWIQSLDDPAGRYATALKNHPYGETSIRHLLQMSSGVSFSEVYNSASDIQFFAGTTFLTGVEYALDKFRVRDAEPGARFKYASIESAVLALVVRGATGKHLADYVSERIWKPLGAEADATWLTDPRGVEIGFAYFNARLRDYGRLGAMLANDGAWNGRQIVSASYLKEATTSHIPPEPESAMNTPAGFGYGYQFWTLAGEERQFAMVGIHGQMVVVHPAKRLVLVQTAVTKSATVLSGNGIWQELSPIWRALVAATPDAAPR